MLPTFVIGLREGLEAALIVGIIAAFLRKQGRDDLLRWVFAGIASAVALCLAVGVALDVLSRDLPQRQQEGLETVVGVLAVAMVTYMVVWMRRHSRELKGSLEGAAASALEAGGDRAGRALVVMAFLAVLREGFETVVFLLAAFNESGSGSGPVAGALGGIAVALVLGYGIYRGGVRLNLSKFFRATGLVLVLVAAGLVMTAFHTAHEAGWLDAGQGRTLDLSWLVRAGTVRASLLTGILGLQPRPVVIELVAWLVYLVPVGAYVAWPQGRRLAARRIAVCAAGLGVVAAVVAGVLLIAAPSTPAGGRAAATADASLVRHGTAVRDGLAVDRYVSRAPAPSAGPIKLLPAAAVAQLNGGRLPLGIDAGSTKIPVSYSTVTTRAVEVAHGTGQVVEDTSTQRVVATAQSSFGQIPLSEPVAVTTASWTAQRVATAVAAARHDLSVLDRRHDLRTAAGWLAGCAVLLLAAAGAAGAAALRRRTDRLATPVDIEESALVQKQVSLT